VPERQHLVPERNISSPTVVVSQERLPEIKYAYLSVRQ